MFTGGRGSYVLATVLTVALHAGIAFLLIRYHDQIAQLQLIEPKPIELRLVDSNFNPLEPKPVQSRLIIEKPPKPEPVQQPRQKSQPKPRQKTQAKQKKSNKSTRAATPKAKKKPEPVKPKLPEKKVEAQKQTPKTQPALQQQPDTPETRIAKRYVTRIQKQIEKNWTKPLNVQYREMAGLKVLIRLTLTPEGQLKDAQIIQSSGNSQFDRSAMNAVFKTGRFQVPGDAAIFEKFFRQVTISYNL